MFNNNQLIKYDLIDLHKDKNVEHRLPIMIKEINNYIVENAPDCVVFEDISLQTNVSTLVLLAQLQGAIMQTCIMNNIEYHTLKSSSWRKMLGFRQGRNIKRPELKQQAKDFVKIKYELELKEDICDAICIGEAFIKGNKEN